jgi:hypothetical protein
MQPPLDCFVAEPVIGSATSGRTRWLLAMTSSPVLATRFAPELLFTPTNLLPPNKKGGGALIGAIQPSSAPSGAAACPYLFLLPRLRGRLGGGAPAFRRSIAALARPVATSIGSAPDPRFLRPGSFGRYPLSPVSSLPSTSETGRSAGRSGTQSRPGAVCETARGHRTRSTFRIASRKRPSLSEIDSVVPEKETNVKPFVAHSDTK